MEQRAWVVKYPMSQIDVVAATETLAKYLTSHDTMYVYHKDANTSTAMFTFSDGEVWLNNAGIELRIHNPITRNEYDTIFKNIVAIVKDCVIDITQPGLRALFGVNK